MGLAHYGFPEGSNPSCGFSWNKLMSWEEKAALALGSVWGHGAVTGAAASSRGTSVWGADGD